jgi:hypothetical protein
MKQTRQLLLVLMGEVHNEFVNRSIGLG